MRPKICESLKTANFNPKLTGYKKNVIDMEMTACRYLGICSASLSCFNFKTD